jgi:hypothetical protein
MQAAASAGSGSGQLKLLGDKQQLPVYCLKGRAGKVPVS